VVAAAGDSGDLRERLGLIIASDGDKRPVEGVTTRGRTGAGFAFAWMDDVKPAREPEDALLAPRAAQDDAAAREAEIIGDEVAPGRQINSARRSGIDRSLERAGVVGHAVAAGAEIMDVGRAR